MAKRLDEESQVVKAATTIVIVAGKVQQKIG
jgi:hypothetical protein